MPSIDFKAIKQNTDIVDLVGRNVKLTKNAGDFEGLCPFHDEKTPSFTVSPTKQIFKCFGCGAGGDVFDYTMLYHKMTHAEAGEYLAGGPLLGGAAPQKLPPRAPAVKWTQISPAPKPTDADLRHYQDGDPSRVWVYKNADGSIYGLVCRFDYPDGSKNVRPIVYCTDGKTSKWKYQAFDKPRQLYNLEKVVFASVVIVVEGEKCADYLQSFFPADENGNYTHAVTCWQGGTNAIQFANLAPLAGKGLIIWPDNDEVGRKCMAYVAEQCAAGAPWVKYVHVPADLPKGWDGADVEWTEKKLREWVRHNIHDHIFKIGDEPDEVVETPPVAPEMRFPEDVAEPMPPAEPEPPRINDKSDNPYFRALGFETDDNGPVFVFFNKRLNCIQRASVGSLTKNFFQMLATDALWTDILGDGFKTENQIQWVINICGSKRMFSETNIRGRGAWFDEGRAILHVGNHLYVDGEKCGLGDLETKYIYSVGFEMDYEDVEPLPAHKGKGVLDLLGRLSWERPVNAVLLAGWCVVAPICGALDWRPHIWVTGPAGTGKSWVFQNVVSTIVGNIALKAQGETSEAGVRQALGSDARPVIFDEAEGEDRKAQERIQSVLQLMRGASTSDGGDTIKGSASGTAKSFKTRSCFAFASIGVPISQQSDRTRITMLTLTKSTMQADEWSNFEREFLELVDSDFIAALRSRTVKMIPTIKRNAKIFSKAAAVHLGSQRAGDQAGVLLAGAYALLEDGEVTYENAKKIIERHDWSEEQGLDKTRDEMRLLAILMDTIIRLDSGAERTVAELVALVVSQKADPVLGHDMHRTDWVTKEAAERRLNQYGFRVDGDMLAVSNSTQQIKKILNDTPWSKEHHRILSRIEGAVHFDSKRFAGTPTRAVGIPLKFIL